MAITVICYLIGLGAKLPTIPWPNEGKGGAGRIDRKEVLAQCSLVQPSGLTKGDSTAATDSVSGTITKTPYTPDGKTAAPTFQQSTSIFTDADATSVTFTLTGAAIVTYKIYVVDADGEALADPTVAAVTFETKPEVATTYYISATESEKTESDRTAVTVKPYEAPKSAEKAITAFAIEGQTGDTVIDEANHTIVVTMPDGTAITALAPTIEVSENATVDPASEVAQDFTAPVTYTVTAEDGTTQRYTVTVTVGEPAPVIHTVTFNSNGGSTVASDTVNDGEKVAKPANPTRSGYDFVNWYSDEELTEAYDFDKAVTIDLILCAKWEKKEEPSYNPPSNTITKTEKNEDGSTTKTVTDKKTGLVTETTTYPDGTKIVATTPKDGKTSTEVTVPKGKESVTVTIPTDAQPKLGEVAVIIHEDGTREIIKTSVSTKDGMRVILTGNAQLEIVDNSKSFADVPADHWGAGAIAFVSSRELFTGTGSGFDPSGNMSRAMLFTVLARLDGQDITGGDTWYAKAMDWAKESGVSDGTNPEASITRESLAVMLYRYAGSPDVGGMALGEFGDVESISTWASDAILWCVNSGILNGNGGKLNPGATATRAEVAAMLQRFIEGLN